MPTVRVVKVDGFEIEIRDTRNVEPGGLTELVPLRVMEQNYARFVLAKCGGNKTRAARVLGIDRRSVYRLLEEHAEDEHKNDEMAMEGVA